MVKQEDTYQTLLEPKQIEELAAIYDDYLYVVRQYEKLMQMSSVVALASFQMNFLYKDHKPDFPWRLSLLDVDEKKEFQDFAGDVSEQNFGHAYISLMHINPADDNAKPVQYIPEQYRVYTMDMCLPSSVERYVVAYPQNAKVGDIEFLIDNLYKATYTKKENADMSVSEVFSNPQIQTEFRILVNLVDQCRHNQYQLTGKYQNLVINLYAAETTAPWENTILEILGSFAVKTQEICRKIYDIPSNENALKRAEQEGLIPSAADFRDYVNIRNLIRHQWDTLDELGYFHSADRNAAQRAECVRSYLKLCDKTIVQRQKAYVEVLQQMQHVIRRILPERVIREKSESNTRFVARLKLRCQQDLQKALTVELNYPFASDKYKALYKNLHKVLPQVKVMEDFLNSQEEFRSLEQDYSRRSWFLHTYHALECKMMTYCVTRGEDLKNRGAWEYCRQHGMILPQEYQTWLKYTHLRNLLSHNFYSSALRQVLRDVEEPYIEHVNALETKLNDASPSSKKVSRNVYMFTHKDGLCVTIDFENRKFLHALKHPDAPQLKVQGKIDLSQIRSSAQQNKPANVLTESYDNGVEFALSNGKVVSFKLPNGAMFNFEKRRLSWDSNVQWHTNAEGFNVLQTNNYKLFTDKELHVTEFWEKRSKQPVRGGDTCLLEYRHRAYVDTIGRLKEFNYKRSDGKVVKTAFKQNPSGVSILFADGTCIAFNGKNAEVMHNGQSLTYDTRQEFAATYGKEQFLLLQNTHGNNSR